MAILCNICFRCFSALNSWAWYSFAFNLCQVLKLRMFYEQARNISTFYTLGCFPWNENYLFLDCLKAHVTNFFLGWFLTALYLHGYWSAQKYFWLTQFGALYFLRKPGIHRDYLIYYLLSNNLIIYYIFSLYICIHIYWSS